MFQIKCKQIAVTTFLTSVPPAADVVVHMVDAKEFLLRNLSVLISWVCSWYFNFFNNYESFESSWKITWELTILIQLHINIIFCFFSFSSATTDFKVCVTVCSVCPTTDRVMDPSLASSPHRIMCRMLQMPWMQAIRTSPQVLWLTQFECHLNCKVDLDLDLCCFLWMHGTVITSQLPAHHKFIFVVLKSELHWWLVAFRVGHFLDQWWPGYPVLCTSCQQL